ncbi:hypothetical protein [Marinobacter sp. AL4B]|uniref:hypothetical protein n=1 Tax=Marinobacter sp. AL4B TaxID=2871173 RepID=UPI001CAA7EEB|nr:hypothetical protein [Marinobacter sp. AL4B]MBZ0333012.1 hypothetical protein [Marinobacter sp. AL4B]
MNNNTEIKLPRKAKGQRPVFFDDPAVDKLISMIFGLTNEMSVLYERQDTLERLLKEKNVVTSDEIESYVPGDSVRKERDARIEIMLSSVLQVLEGDVVKPRDKENNISYDEAIALSES